MHSGRKGSVRTSLSAAIFVTVVLTWIISGGVANYIGYMNMLSLRNQMALPGGHRMPAREPRFGVLEFLTGRPPLPPPVPPQDTDGASRGPQPQEDVPPWIWRDLALRLTVAFAAAGLAGVTLARWFTRPLAALASGAGAYQAGVFEYRIPACGHDEFAAVAQAMNDMAAQVSGHIRRLEDEAQRRRQFLADMAHELRSPVTTLCTMAGALRDGVADDPDRRAYAIAAIYDTAQRLSRLVQDLMELAQLDHTELPLKRRPTDLRTLVRKVLEAHRDAAHRQGVTLESAQDGPPVWAHVDADRLTQVIDNVIGNAVAYAGEGARVHVLIDAGDPIRICIIDTGRGISAEHLPHVLDPFYRADPARSPHDGHSGLGLSIASRLVKAHGGALSVHSVPGEGVTVEITIPKDEDALR